VRPPLDVTVDPRQATSLRSWQDRRKRRQDVLLAPGRLGERGRRPTEHYSSCLDSGAVLMLGGYELQVWVAASKNALS